MKTIVIYPGRFQPMLKHHAQVYNQLQRSFPDAEVYIGTSDKVEGDKSPFTFREKQMIAQGHGIPAERVLPASRPYHKDEYQQFDENNTVIIFAVGEKDTDRFPMNNVDPKTGLDMKVRGEPGPKYYQMINTINSNPLPMSERGYIYIAPTISDDNDDIASASEFRNSLRNAPDLNTAKEIFAKQFEYNESLFKMIYNKIKGSEMKEQLNVMRKLAGLSPLAEDAPVEFDVNPSAVTFLEPSKSSAKMSIANRFPKDADPNDPAVKKEQFIQALLRSPASLLSEINERIDPKDSNNEAIGTKLTDIINSLGSDKGIGDLSEDDKKFVLEVVKVAIKDMDLVAGDDSPDYEGEPDPDADMDFESVDLSDIRSDYDINEGDGTEGQCPECDGSGCDHCDDTGMDPEFGNDDDAPSQDEIDAHMKEQDLEENPLAIGAWNFLRTAGMNVGRWMAANPIKSAAAGGTYSAISSLPGEIADAGSDAVQGIAAASTADVLKFAGKTGLLLGLLYGGKKLIDWMVSKGASKQEASAAEREWQTKFRGSQQHQDLMTASGAQEESFDPSMEPSREQVAYDEAMEVLANEGEEGLAKHLGMSEQEFDQEINQWCAEHGKHADDDREEAIDGVLDEIIGNADWDDHYEAVEEGYPFQDQDLLDPEHQPDHINNSRTLSGFTQFFVSNINQFMDYKKVSVADIDELVHELNTQPGFDYLVQGWNHYALGKEKSYDPMDPKLVKAFMEKIIKGQPDIRHDLSNTLIIKGNDVIARHARDDSGKRYDPTEDQRSTKYDEVKGGRPGLNKPENEAVEEAKCGCCGNEITDKGCGCDEDCPHCGGKGKVDEAGCGGSHKKKKAKEAVEDTAGKALEAALNELKALAGI